MMCYHVLCRTRRLCARKWARENRAERHRAKRIVGSHDWCRYKARMRIAAELYVRVTTALDAISVASAVIEDHSRLGVTGPLRKKAWNFAFGPLLSPAVKNFLDCPCQLCSPPVEPSHKPT